LQVVTELRALGHDVLTSFEAGNANKAIPEHEVLAFAMSDQRILVSLNKRHFLQIHHQRTQKHPGMVLCTFDKDSARQAKRIHAAISAASDMTDQLVRKSAELSLD
jgi:hypothetical protein